MSPSFINSEVPAGRFSVKLSPSSLFRLIICVPSSLVSIEVIVPEFVAVREGLVVDWMCRNNYLKDQLSFQGSIRERTVIHQAKRFGVNSKRSKSVSEFALTFYDQTKGILHNDNGGGRDLLWAAAKLHACGKQINISAYHKHSWYLIKNGELLGQNDSLNPQQSDIFLLDKKISS